MLISPFCSDMLLNSVLLPFPAMFRTDFNYRLPVDLIAQVPAKNREERGSNESGHCQHGLFCHDNGSLPDDIHSG